MTFVTSATVIVMNHYFIPMFLIESNLASLVAGLPRFELSETLSSLQVFSKIWFSKIHIRME